MMTNWGMAKVLANSYQCGWIRREKEANVHYCSASTPKAKRKWSRDKFAPLSPFLFSSGNAAPRHAICCTDRFAQCCDFRQRTFYLVDFGHEFWTLALLVEAPAFPAHMWKCLEKGDHYQLVSIKWWRPKQVVCWLMTRSECLFCKRSRFTQCACISIASSSCCNTVLF